MESTTPRPSSSVRPGNGTAATTSAKPGYVGKRIGRFRIVSLIGRGAMGSVFRAEDVDLQRHVALKVILDKSVAGRRPSDKVEQFIREARSAARLEHPHVVAIHEVNRTADIHYIAMELVEGGNLHELLSSGPMDVIRACQLCAEAAEALQYAHEQGVVHRDVKPANLMLARNGRCKLADFGLARIDDPSDSFSMQSASVGTPLYAAPEVFRHEPATAQSDVYSLGATLFHLLTGRPPYEGAEAVEVMQQHLNSPVPDLLAMQPELPPTLAAAIAKAMAKEPADRFDSAGKLARVLRLHTVPVGSSTGSGSLGASIGMSGMIPGSTPAAKTAKIPIGLWIGIAAGVLAIAGVGAYVATRPPTPPPLTAVAPPTASLPKPPAPIEPPAPPIAPATPAATRVPAIKPPALPSATPADASNDIPATDAATLLRLAKKEDPRSSGEVTIVGQIKDVNKATSGKIYFVNFEGVDKDGFVAAYFPTTAQKFTAAFPGGDDVPALAGKKVRVTGKVELYRDRPEIVLKSPEQIKVVE